MLLHEIWGVAAWVLNDGQVVWCSTHYDGALKVFPDIEGEDAAIKNMRDNGHCDIFISGDTLWVRMSWDRFNKEQKKAVEKIARKDDLKIKEG